MLIKENINWICYNSEVKYITVFYKNKKVETTNYYDNYHFDYKIYQYPKFIKKFIHKLYNIFKFQFLFQIDIFLQDPDFYKIDDKYYINIYNVYDIEFGGFSFLTNCKISFNGFYYEDETIRMTSHFLVEDKNILNYIEYRKRDEKLKILLQ